MKKLLLLSLPLLVACGAGPSAEESDPFTIVRVPLGPLLTLSVDGTTPSPPVDNQQVGVRYRLANASPAQTTGRLSGNIDGIALHGTAPDYAQINNLFNGTVTGTMLTTGQTLPIGAHTIHLIYEQVSGSIVIPYPYPHTVTTYTTAATVDAAINIVSHCPTPSPRFDEVQQRSLHNAYQRDEALLDMLIYYRLRDLEFDIHSQPRWNNCGTEFAGTNDWFVYHTVGSYRYERLSDVLRLLRAYQRAVPQHEVVTINLEFKGEHDGTNCAGVFPDGSSNAASQTPEGLDALLRSYLGSSLYTAGDLLRACPQANGVIQTAINPANCGWPTVNQLRGKFIFVAHGAAGQNAIALDQRYLASGATAAQRVVWYAPITGTFDPTLHNYNAFVTDYNAADSNGQPHPEWALNYQASYPGTIMRSADKNESDILSGNDDATLYNHDPAKFAALQLAYQRILTDEVSWQRTPMYRTHNRFAYPFCPIGVVGAACWDGTQHRTSEMIEPAQLMRLDVRSDDIGGTADSFAFANETSTANASWSAFVSAGSNTDVPDQAKGCLMARASYAADAPYYAVCRNADGHELFTQWRATGCNGACGTASASASLGAGMQGEDALFVRLDVTHGSGSLTAQGYGSVDGGITWQAIGAPVTFAGDLPLQGIAASSHTTGAATSDGQPIRFLFGNVAKSGVAYQPSSFPSLAGVGNTIYQKLYDYGAAAPVIASDCKP